RVKLMWVGYPHMPTGARARGDPAGELVDFAKHHDILLVNANPYSFVLGKGSGSRLSIDGATDSSPEPNPLSKPVNMAGWRAGRVLGSAQHIQAVLQVKSNMDSGMFYGIQKGAIAALKSGPDWFEALDGVYTRRRELMFQLADALGCRYDRNAVGMFLWAELPKGSKDSEDYIDQLLHEKDIFVAPGTIFGSKGQGYIRFSLCVKEEKIIEAIKRF